MEAQEDIVSKAMLAMAAEKAASAPAHDFSGADLQATGLVKVYGDRTVVNGMDVACSCAASPGFESIRGLPRGAAGGISQSCQGRCS